MIKFPSVVPRLRATRRDDDEGRRRVEVTFRKGAGSLQTLTRRDEPNHARVRRRRRDDGVSRTTRDATTTTVCAHSRDDNGNDDEGEDAPEEFGRRESVV